MYVNKTMNARIEIQSASIPFDENDPWDSTKGHSNKTEKEKELK
jgi:hypothetical protein